MKPTKMWKSLPGVFILATKDFEEHAKFCDDESVEKDYAIKDATGARRYDRRSALGSRSALALTPKEQVETLGATITGATEWEVIPLQAFFKNGRVKFKYIWLENEQ